MKFPKLTLLIVALAGFALAAAGQEKYYDLKPVKQIKTTPSKDLQRIGSCWANAGTALLEAEWIKNGKPEIDLAEMTFITDAYRLKADAHLKSKGETRVDEKGIAQDVFTLMTSYGMAPEEMYMKSDYQPENASSGEMDAIIRATLHMVMTKEGGNFTENWKNTFDASLSRYLGETRISFPYNGNDYTPKSFAEASGLNAADYVTLTSDGKSNMDSKIVLTAKNNWSKTQAYNVSADNLVNSLKSAVNGGFTVIWYGAVPAEMIFAEEQVAIVPAGKIADLTKVKEGEEKYFIPLPEKEVSASERQAAFEASAKAEQSYMLVYGISKDKNGGEFFIAKKACEGGDKILHLSPSFIKLNTAFLVLNKKGLPGDVKSKFGL